MTILSVKISPNAAKNGFEGWQGDTLRIRIHAVPEKGKANDELIAFLAKSWKIPKSAIKVVSGNTSRLKRIKIEGKTLEEIKALLKEDQIK